jgi:hypothetical protein
MHNPLYRINVGQSAQRNFGSAEPDYYLGTGMTTPPTPNIYLAGNTGVIEGPGKNSGVSAAVKLSKGMLTLSIPQGKTASVSLFDVGGRCVYNNAVFTRSQLLRPVVPKGIFILKVKSDDAVLQTSKLNLVD